MFPRAEDLAKVPYTIQIEEGVSGQLGLRFIFWITIVGAIAIMGLFVIGGAELVQVASEDILRRILTL